MKIHPKITEKRIANAMKRSMHGLDSPGFCIDCGADADGVEPDARKYKCESCGAMAVYGAEEILISNFG